MKVLWDGFIYSDGVGRAITAALLAANALLWALLVCKFFQTRAMKKAIVFLRERLAKYGSCTHKILGDLDHDRSLTGPLADLGRAASAMLLEILKPTAQQKYAFFSEGILPRALTAQELERVQVAIETEITRQKGALEALLPGLASLITLAPMCGLFGTVWGVMATFVGIVNNGGRPDIQAIAPGIAGALLTTVAGLFVAIPGTLCNNSIVSTVDEISQEMEDFRDELLTSLQLAKTAQPKPQVAAAAPAVAPQPQPARTAAQPAMSAAPAYQQQPVMAAPQPQPSQPVYSQPVVSGVSRDTAVEISVEEDMAGGSPDGYAR
jgi:biopolymer transport protein TolQ